MAELPYVSKLLQFHSPSVNLRSLYFNHSSFTYFSPLRLRCCRRRGLSFLPTLSSPRNSLDLLLISTSVQSDGSLVFKFGDESEIPTDIYNVDGLDTVSNDAETEVKLETQKDDDNLVVNDQVIHSVSNSENHVIDDVEVKDLLIEHPNGDNGDDVFDMLSDNVEIDVDLETEGDQNLDLNDHPSGSKFGYGDGDLLIELPKSNIKNAISVMLSNNVEIDVELETESDQNLALDDHTSVSKLEHDDEDSPVELPKSNIKNDVSDTLSGNVEIEVVLETENGKNLALDDYTSVSKLENEDENLPIELPKSSIKNDVSVMLSDNVEIEVELETGSDQNLALNDHTSVSKLENDNEDSPIPKSNIKNDVSDLLSDIVEIDVEWETESDQILALNDHTSDSTLENDDEDAIEAKVSGIEVVNTVEMENESALGSIKIEDSIVQDSKLFAITDSGFDAFDDEESVKEGISEKGLDVVKFENEVTLESGVIDDDESVKEVVTKSDFDVENLENEVALEDIEFDEEEGVKGVTKDVDEVTKQAINPQDLVVALEIQDSVVEDPKFDLITETGREVGSFDTDVALENVDEAVEEVMDLPIVQFEADLILDEEVNDTGLPSIVAPEDSLSGDHEDAAFPNVEPSTITSTETIAQSVQIATVGISVPSAIASVSQPIEVNDALVQQSDGDLCSDIDTAANQWSGILSTAEMSDRGISRNLTFSGISSAASLANSTEVLSGGDDAYFICKNWFGVADGVGQWSFGGSDKGLYAQEFIQNCESLARESLSTGLSSCKELLQQSAAITRSPGAARVLIAHISDQVLHVAYIGDSGFLIIRNGTVFKKSCPMFHEFNFPYAISSGVNPMEAVGEYCVELEEGDIIVTATDGLFDNLYETEIAAIVYKAVEDGKDIKDIAELLAGRAQEVGRSPYARTPFADAAHEAGHTEFSGGKFDHVTVIVSLLQTE